MSDLISRNDVIDAIRKQLNDTNALIDIIGRKGVDPTEPIIHLFSVISAIPPADRPTGKWIFNPKDAIELMFTLPKCSECGFESSDCGNYCSNCGAKMKGGTE